MDKQSSFDRHKASVDGIGIGRIIDWDAKRDAIHFACAPVEAGMVLGPGSRVSLTDGKAYLSDFGSIGIVDPFLAGPVKVGERFWLILNPGSITALRHAWEHPGFAEEVPESPPQEAMGKKAESEAWLRAFCDSADCPGYEAVLAAATGHGAAQWDDDYLHFDGSEARGDIPSEFWDHVEVLTGYRPARPARYFSCSC